LQLEETHLAVVNESRFSFLFCAKMKKSAAYNQFANVVKEHVWPYFQFRQKKILDCFQTVRQPYLISLYRMHAVCIAFIACDITFIAYNNAFVAFVTWDKCDIAFVASMFYPTPFLVTPFYPMEEGGDIIAGMTMTMDANAAIIAAGMMLQREEAVALSGGRSRACINVGHRRGRLRLRHWPSSTSAIVAAVD
jgi:hypothetical protein